VGDEREAESFECFYRERWTGALRLAHVLCGNRATAEDVTQEAFAQLYRRFDTVADPENYLRASILNGVRSLARRDERATRRLRLTRTRVHVELLPDELLDAVDRLPYREKAVLVLRYYEDLPDPVIAAAIGCRPATVRTVAARALRRLRREVPR
jgi:RNA polymerase sigma factor (sigma-70 family)